MLIICGLKFLPSYPSNWKLSQQEPPEADFMRPVLMSALDLAIGLIPKPFDFDYPTRYGTSDLDHGVNAQISTTVDQKIVVGGCNPCHPHGILSPSRFTIVQR